jgi:hypothetical protein
MQPNDSSRSLTSRPLQYSEEMTTVTQEIRRRVSMARKLVLPDTVTVLGVPFAVRIYDGVGEGENGGDESGCTYGDLRLIKVSEHQDSRRQWTTLLHEVIHATLHVNGLGNKLDEMTEEVIAQSLEHSLEQFLLQHGEQLLKALSVQKADI